MRVVLLFLLAGCYDPSLQPCSVRCSEPADCAGGLTCGPDGWCAAGTLVGRCGDRMSSTPDAALTVDALDPPVSIDASVDAPLDSPPAPVCAPGCNGSCEDGVCVIRCSGPNACGMDVRCPMTGPCRVECTGNMSCRKKVVCGEGDCEVICQGPNSCKEGVQCMNACACDVTCSGSESCDKPAMCPGPLCDTGDGCSSAAPVCNTCS